MRLGKSALTTLKRDGFDLTIQKNCSHTTLTWAYPEKQASGGMVVSYCTDYLIHEDGPHQAERSDSKDSEIKTVKHLVLTMHTDHPVHHTMVLPAAIVGEIRPMLEEVLNERVKPEGIKLFPFIKTVILVGLLSFAGLIAVDIISTKMVVSGSCSAITQALNESVSTPSANGLPQGAMKPVPPSGGSAETWVPPASVNQP